jgi:hypothetical protein
LPDEGSMDSLAALVLPSTWQVVKSKIGGLGMIELPQANERSRSINTESTSSCLSSREPSSPAWPVYARASLPVSQVSLQA